MDYTLIHYHVERWEELAYESTRDAFARRAGRWRTSASTPGP